MIILSYRSQPTLANLVLNSTSAVEELLQDISTILATVIELSEHYVGPDEGRSHDEQTLQHILLHSPIHDCPGDRRDAMNAVYTNTVRGRGRLIVHQAVEQNDYYHQDAI